jgi:hypothetical protein
MTGYSFSVGPVRYAADRAGRPLTLVDCWRAVHGTGQARIYSPTGRLVLANAGALSVRSNLRRTFNRSAAKAARVIREYHRLVLRNTTQDYNAQQHVAYDTDGVYGVEGEVFDLASQMGLSPADETEADRFYETLQQAARAYQARLRLIWPAPAAVEG